MSYACFVTLIRILEAEYQAREIATKYLCNSILGWIAHVEKHEIKRGFGSHQFWHRLRVALDSDGIIGCCPPGCALVLHVFLVGSSINRLLLSAAAQPADFRPSPLLARRAVVPLQLGLVRSDLAVDTRAKHQAGAWMQWLGYHSV